EVEEQFRSKIQVRTDEQYDPVTRKYNKKSVDCIFKAIDNQVQIIGDFDIYSTYEIILSSELAGISGAALGEERSVSIAFNTSQKKIQFANSKGNFLSSQGAKNIAVEIIGIEKINVKIYKIFQNNLIHFIRNGYHSAAAWDAVHYGDELYNREFLTQDLPRHNGLRLLNLNIEDFRKEFKGAFLIELSTPEGFYYSVTKLVCISDIGLLAHYSATDMLILANSIQTNQSLSGVKISVISSNNQLLFSEETDRKGAVHFKDLPAKLKQFRQALITAEKGDEFSFLLVTPEQATDLSRFDVGGKTVTYSDKGQPLVDAFIYADRELYRPGDTAHFNIICRTFDWKIVKNEPIKIKIRQPDGKEANLGLKVGTTNTKLSFKSMEQLSESGSLLVDYIIPTSAITGTYSVEVYSGADRFLKSKSIAVEEFMPDRIRVRLDADEKPVPGKSITVRGNAMNLFGTSAANRNYEVQFSLTPNEFVAKEFADYTFSLLRKTKSAELAQGVQLVSARKTGSTDKDGNFQEEFSISSQFQNQGKLSAQIYATVFDENARPVHRSLLREVITQPYFLGIQTIDRYVNTKEPVKVPLIAVTPDGKPTSGQAKIQVLKVEYQYLFSRYSGGYAFDSKKTERILSERIVSLNPKSEYLFTPHFSGDYEIRVFLPGADAYVSWELFAYGGEFTESNAFSVNNEGSIDIQFGKETYQLGETAEAILKTPFDGTILLTLERNGILSYETIEAKNHAASFSFRCKEEHLPNVYLTATLIRPMDGRNFPLTVARGFQSVRIEAKERKLPVKIIANSKIRSNTRQTVRIQTAANTNVTVAVVDEGILQIRNTKSPDPYEYFYQKRALDVLPVDLYGLLLPEIPLKSRQNQSTGGDSGFERGLRTNPFTAQRTKLISKWSYDLKTNSSGEVSFTFDVPQFSGELRVMAVAYQENAFGNAESKITVADPIVISTSAPRFLSPGDTALIPVVLMNTTNNSGTVTATLSVSGSAELTSANSGSVLLRPMGENRVLFKIAASSTPGIAKLNVKVNGFGGNLSEGLELSVRPSAGLLKISDAGSIDAGRTVEINFAEPPTKQTVRLNIQSARLVISRNPVVQFAKSLDFLIDYPHGCLEQTISTAFPQIYYSDLVKSLQKKQVSNQTATQNVIAAIAKLSTLQTYSGGFSYWSGESEPSWFGTAYALHFLLEAQKAGYIVPTSLYQKAIDYLVNKLRVRETEYFMVNNERKTIPRREIFYSLYVLALANQKQLATMNYYKSIADQLSVDSRYLLACTYAYIGD
ncbi:MAG: MG2 domain-containing protein, partial [Bacteroidia bacterium]|nr:MG2 domain-containing protein [Bacteroidia bacterium]